MVLRIKYALDNLPVSKRLHKFALILWSCAFRILRSAPLAQTEENHLFAPEICNKQECFYTEANNSSPVLPFARLQVLTSSTTLLFSSY